MREAWQMTRLISDWHAEGTIKKASWNAQAERFPLFLNQISTTETWKVSKLKLLLKRVSKQIDITIGKVSEQQQQ